MRIMNKKLLAGLITASVMSVSGVSYAASAEVNPLASVPKDHWAYSAVEKLVNDGLVDGYTDGEFKGDRSISRYEMAILVAKAMSNVEKADQEDQAAIAQLQNEFGDELKNLGVRMKKIEDGMSSFKWFGDARVRYFANQDGKAHDKDGKSNNSKFEQRLRLGFYGDIDKNLSINGRLKAEDKSHVSDGSDGAISSGSTHDTTRIDKLDLKWQAPHQVTVDAGRMEVSLGQGGVWWENPIDGIAISKDFGKTSVQVGYGDLTAENWQDNSMPAFFANVKTPVSDKVNVTAALLKTNGNGHNTVFSEQSAGNWVESPFSLKQYALGVNAQLSDKVNWFVEGIQNKADNLPDDADNKGWWTRVTYGNQKWDTAKTWQVYGEYFNLGGYAVDSTGWGHRMNIAGGNGFGGAGAKGFGIGASYMLAANTNLELTYYNLKPYDDAKAGFDKYKSMGYAALSYSF